MWVTVIHVIGIEAALMSCYVKIMFFIILMVDT